MGSSTTKSSFDLDKLADLMGIRREEIVNLATMPNNPEITLNILIENHRLLSDATVLYGVDPWILSSLYYQHFNYRINTWSFQERVSYLRRSNVTISNAFNVMNGGNLSVTITSVLGRDQLLTPGEIDNANADDNALPVVEDWFGFPHFKVSPYFMDALTKIDSLCYESNGRLVAYYTGYGYEWTEQYNELSFSHSLMNSIKESFEFAKFRKLSESYPDSLFWDGIHVNSYGKELKTLHLSTMLNSHWK